MEPRRRMRDYVRGLLGPVGRKNGWQLAEYAGHGTPDGLQHLLSRSRWEADDVRDDLQAYVAEHLGTNKGVQLVYADGVREHIEQARSQQAMRSHRDDQAGLARSQASLATDLEITKADNQRLRAEVATLRRTIQRQLGQSAGPAGRCRPRRPRGGTHMPEPRFAW
ncbi:transposase [Streptomyces sp. NBC_00057]|uniref:transposase n=1 Tax=Streptomyces sp. NBC_00057 TaxID=2975634 RepID=UPI00387096CE